MEISVIRKRVRDAIDRAKRRRAMDRRTRTDDARRAFEAFLEHTAVPMFRQIDNVLRVEGYEVAFGIACKNQAASSRCDGSDH